MEVHVPEVGCVECELLDVQESIGQGFLHERCGVDTARRPAVEVNLVEVDEIHYIGDVDVGQLGPECVGGKFRDASADIDVPLGLTDGEVLHIDYVVMILDGGRLDLPK